MPTDADPNIFSVSWQTLRAFVGASPFQVLHRTRHRHGRNGQQHVDVVAVDRAGVNDHLVRLRCLAQQLTASLPHIAPKDGESIFRNPYKMVLAVPDQMAAAFVALHTPVYTGHAAVPCRLKMGFPDRLSGTLKQGGAMR